MAIVFDEKFNINGMLIDQAYVDNRTGEFGDAPWNHL